MKENIDFVAVARRFKELGSGPKAELRRVAKPDDLLLVPAFYRLLPGVKTNPQWQRVVFFLPFVRHMDSGLALGQQLSGRVTEERLFQVLRSSSPNDLIQLRRLVQQVEPTVNWQCLGESLYFWGEKSKRRLIEDYFTPVPKSEKEAES
jgi:CRISPR system Cascade subunit CasB